MQVHDSGILNRMRDGVSRIRRECDDVNTVRSRCVLITREKWRMTSESVNERGVDQSKMSGDVQFEIRISCRGLRSSSVLSQAGFVSVCSQERWITRSVRDCGPALATANA